MVGLCLRPALYSGTVFRTEAPSWPPVYLAAAQTPVQPEDALPTCGCHSLTTAACLEPDPAWLTTPCRTFHCHLWAPDQILVHFFPDWPELWSLVPVSKHLNTSAVPSWQPQFILHSLGSHSLGCLRPEEGRDLRNPNSAVYKWGTVVQGGGAHSPLSHPEQCDRCDWATSGFGILLECQSWGFSLAVPSQPTEKFLFETIHLAFLLYK